MKVDLVLLLLIFLFAVIVLNNKRLNQDVSYMLSGILSFLFVFGLIYVLTTIF